MLETYSARIAAPFAVLGIRTTGEWLTGIDYLPLGAPVLAPLDAFSAAVCRQLEAYLRDPDFRFDLPCRNPGSGYQQRVWGAIQRIPRGQTMSYAEVAGRIGSAPRPVGMACGANRVPLLIPCHRVVASGGIGGFMHSRGGRAIEIKRWLLRHEGVRLLS
ncbi:MAG TPA: methylated-DNA--[protein]-cysteine S-methyltransferase [Burkholderiales bacterium]|nr:methylated-DNA--[protein]-cysteine S-methyltransferase [Burkholderiales bacterium]